MSEPETGEREKKLALLRRQRATLDDLFSRRDGLASQLESASLMLQNIRLDLIALRAAGVQSSIDDVSTATQEARALSRDIGHVLEAAMLRLAPMALEVFAFATIYKVVPHRTVQWRHAIAGALLATVLFELVKGGIGIYLGTFGNYSRIYGTLAFVPVFLLWIFMSWIAVLLGASLASSISAFRYQPVSMRLPEGYEMYGLLRLLARFNEARTSGAGLHTDDIQRLEPLLTDSLVQEMLAQLAEINVVRRAEGGEWLLARDLDSLSLAELYEACQLRIPVAEAHLPCRDDALGKSAVAALDELRVPLRALLKRRVSTIHAEED